MAKTAPKISIIERRLQGPNVHRTSSCPIPLKDDKWTIRWENSAISPDHIWDIIQNKGWVYVSPDDLDCSVEEAGGFVRDGKVVRGERGQEVLVKMLIRDYKRVEKKKTEVNILQTFGKKQIKDAIVSGVASEHGDRAAEYVAQNVNAITVNDARGPEEGV